MWVPSYSSSAEGQQTLPALSHSYRSQWKGLASSIRPLALACSTEGTTWSASPNAHSCSGNRPGLGTIREASQAHSQVGLQE